MYTPKHLELWTPADPAFPSGERNYAGADWSNWYIAYTKTRDASVLSESNWDEMKKALQPLSNDITEDGDELPSVYVMTTSHWAVGYIEWLLVHKSNEVALQKADELAERLKDYPVLNEEDFSEREWNYICESWENASVKERVDLCKSAGISIFAARHDTLPEDSDYIYERLRPE